MLIIIQLPLQGEDWWVIGDPEYERGTRGNRGGRLAWGGFKGEDQSVSLSHAVAAERQIYTQIAHQHKHVLVSLKTEETSKVKTNINLVCFTVNHKGGKAHLKLHPRDALRFQDKK